MANSQQQFKTAPLKMSDVAASYNPKVVNTAYTPFAPLTNNVADAIASYRAGQANAESALTGQPVTTQPTTGLANTGVVPYNTITGQLGEPKAPAAAGPTTVDMNHVAPMGTPAQVSTPTAQSFNAADNYQTLAKGTFNSDFNNQQARSGYNTGFNIRQASNNPYTSMVDAIANGQTPNVQDPREAYIQAHSGLSNAGAIYDILAEGKRLQDQFEGKTEQQPKKKLSDVVRENQAKLTGDEYAWAHQNPMAEGMGYQWNDDALRQAGWGDEDIADLKSITDMHPQMINELRNRGFLATPWANQ